MTNLQKLTQEKRGKTQITKRITISFTEIRGILREYYEQEYVNTFDTLDERDKFLERHKPPKQTQEEIENLNLTYNKFNTEQRLNQKFLNFATRRARAQMVSKVNSTKHCKKNSKLSPTPPKTEEERTLLSSS